MTIAPLSSLSQATPVRADADDRPAASGPTPAPSGASAAPLLNPDPVIDSSLGIVVLQYFSQAGDLTQTFPSRRQLDTYQIYGLAADADPA